MKLTIFSIIFSIVITIFTGSVAYKITLSSLSSVVEVAENATSSSNYEVMNGWLKEKEGLVLAISEVIANNNFTDDEIQRIVLSSKRIFKEVDIFYVGYTDGKYITSSIGSTLLQKDYDPRTRLWYKVAMESDDIRYTGFYESATGKGKCITISKKIIKEGKVNGVIALDIDYSTFNAKLLGLKGIVSVNETDGMKLSTSPIFLKTNVSHEQLFNDNVFFLRMLIFFVSLLSFCFFGIIIYIVYSVEKRTHRLLEVSNGANRNSNKNAR